MIPEIRSLGPFQVDFWKNELEPEHSKVQGSSLKNWFLVQATFHSWKDNGNRGGVDNDGDVYPLWQRHRGGVYGLQAQAT